MFNYFIVLFEKCTGGNLKFTNIQYLVWLPKICREFCLLDICGCIIQYCYVEVLLCINVVVRIVECTKLATHNVLWMKKHDVRFI